MYGKALKWSVWCTQQCWWRALGHCVVVCSSGEQSFATEIKCSSSCSANLLCKTKCTFQEVGVAATENVGARRSERIHSRCSVVCSEVWSHWRAAYCSHTGPVCCFQWCEPHLVCASACCQLPVQEGGFAVQSLALL